jgi:hypothetical protein
MAHPHHLPAVERQLFWRLRRLDLRRDQSPAFPDDVKQSIQEMNQLAHPRALLSIKVGKSVVNERVLRSVLELLSLRDDHGLFCLGNLMGYDNAFRRRLYQQHGAGIWRDGVDVC